ncbi:hypothetical protein Hanom_Chr04g00324201 [Helianthus anomalus]
MPVHKERLDAFTQNERSGENPPLTFIPATPHRKVLRPKEHVLRVSKKKRIVFYDIRTLLKFAHMFHG